MNLELRIVILRIDLVKFRESNVMLILVGTCNIGKLHETIQAHPIISSDSGDRSRSCPVLTIVSAATTQERIFQYCVDFLDCVIL